MALRKLTARFVETVAADGSRLEIRDAVARGLELRVSPAGAKIWALRYRRPADRAKRTVTLGAYPTFSLEDARRWATEIRSGLARGLDPAAQRDQRKAAETFAEIAEEWIERHGKPNKSPRALRDDRSMLDRHVLPTIGHLKALEISKRDLIALFDAVSSKDDARNSRTGAGRRLTHRPNRVFELVRAIFRWAMGRDLISADPTLGMSPPIKKEKPRERELSPDEIQKLWRFLEHAPEAPRSQRGQSDVPMSRATAIALLLSLATAQRIGEVTGIAMVEIDLSHTASMWTVPGARSKNGEPNRVPLSPVAVRLVRAAMQLAGGAPWLFPSPKGDAPTGSHAPTRALGRAREALGVEDFRVHDLRRTAATRMAEMGISPHTISVVLNHVSARRGTITGKVYNRYGYDREKREALDAWGARLEKIVSQGRDGAAVHYLFESDEMARIG